MQKKELGEHPRIEAANEAALELLAYGSGAIVLLVDVPGSEAATQAVFAGVRGSR